MLFASEFLSENEIAAASIVAPATFNAQDQRHIDWPVRPIVARAYLDQLERTETLSERQRSTLSGLLDRADRSRGDRRDVELAGELTTAASDIRRGLDSASGRDEIRLSQLADILSRLSETRQ